MKEPHHVESQIVSFCLNIVHFTSQYFYRTPVRSMPGLVSYSATNALYSVHLIDVTLVVEERVIDVVADITGVRDGLEVDIG